jgi:glycosyltransferase involved in cell wall biosynthesis
MTSVNPQRRVLFIYLGRRGALSQFALELARAAADRAVLVISRQNELFGEIAAAGAPVIAVDTFGRAVGAVLRLYRVAELCRRVTAALRGYRADTAIVLMSHVWTPLIARTVKRAGARYVVVVHDVDPHPGDPTALVNQWLLRDVGHADRVITLSEHVTRQLTERGIVEAERVQTLFHPMLGADREQAAGPPAREGVAFLFFGRIMRYKGLPLFVEACEILRREGRSFAIGVVGEGDMGDLSERLERLGAEVINHWVAHGEIAAVMHRYDAVVVPSTEASQSGVVALAHGHGLPAIITPIGGLPGQVEPDVTGLAASSVSAAAIADEMRRYLLDDDLRRRLREGVQARRDATSMSRFVDALAAV